MATLSPPCGKASAWLGATPAPFFQPRRAQKAAVRRPVAVTLGAAATRPSHPPRYSEYRAETLDALQSA